MTRYIFGLVAEARALLSARQKLVVALQLLDRQLSAGDPPARRALLTEIIGALELDTGALAAHRATLALKNDLELVPQ